MNYLKIKNLLDKCSSLVLIIILIPLLVITAIAIKVESKGPVIFKQKRLGQDGKEFWIYKFRSMKLNAESGGVYELKNDTRVTKVGNIIRKTSIDELPQLFNILKGDMSIIGPRPTLTYHPYKYEDYSELQKNRFLVKPGVTGLAQINGRKQIDWVERINLDISYVKKIGFITDLTILLKTIVKVTTMDGNINLGKTVSLKKGDESHWKK